MTIERITIAILVIVLGWLGFQQNLLQDSILEMESANTALQSNLEQETRGLSRNLEQKMNALGQIPSASEIASELVDANREKIVDDVAEILTNNRSYAGVLRGPQGDKPSIDKIVSGLLQNEIAMASLGSQIAAKLANTPEYAKKLRGEKGDTPSTQQVAEQFLLIQGDENIYKVIANWIFRDNRELFISNEAMLAGVAEAVYTRYGNDLKPDAASAASIAETLADSPLFADLVATAVKHQ